MSRIRIAYGIYAVMGCIVACSLTRARAAGLPDVTVLVTGELLANVPLSIRITGETLAGTATGKGEATLTVPKSWAGRVLNLNGKPVGSFDAEGRIALSLHTGGGALAVEQPTNQGEK